MRTARLLCATFVLACFGLTSTLNAQPPGERSGPNGTKMKLLERFDTDGNGRLDATERVAARAYAKENRSQRRRRGRRGGGGEPAEVKAGRPFAIKDAKVIRKRPLYDTTSLRTIFLEFPHDDWEGELQDFYRTDVDVPAKMTVDGKTYEGVGVRFRGNSSFFTVGAGRKRSLNLAVDHTDSKLDLYGYKTLNLLNAHTDPSYMREFLASMIANEYLPAPKANFVRVVINGECWGIYVNAQQFNRDFLEENFGTRKGVRWKVPAGRGAAAGLVDLGDVDAFKNSYLLRTPDAGEGAWQRLAAFCQALATTRAENLERELDRLLNLDRALWFLAVDNALQDGDGYLSRGSDFALYEDPTGRFHPIPHDSNETFRYTGGGGPGFRRPGSGGATQSPLIGAEDGRVPLASELLDSHPLRARYLHHLRTIANEWLDWEKLGPIVERHQRLIDDDLRQDVKMLTPYEQFVISATEETGSGRRPTPGIRQFVTERREALLAHEAIAGPWPKISRVWIDNVPTVDEPARIVATPGGGLPVVAGFIYYATKRNGRFTRVAMERSENGDFVGSIPAQPLGKRVRYYVEGRSGAASRTDFFPSNTEQGALSYRVAPAKLSTAGLVVINEVMADNGATVTDPQGDFDDWIEIYNRSDEIVDLSGSYLADDPRARQRWSFPAQTLIEPGGYRIIWADGDTDAPGLHASFKLSRRGETLILGRISDGKAVDFFRYSDAEKDRSMGRTASGSIREMAPTPARANEEPPKRRVF